MAGRCYIQEIFPLTLPEILTDNWNNEPKLSVFQQFIQTGLLPETLPSFKLYPDFVTREEAFNYYLNNGGYPALVNADLTDEDRYEWLLGYIRTYLERDIRDLADFKSLEPFIKIQKMTSLLTAQLVNFSQLGNEAGVSSKTAQRFLQYLEISYQTIILQPWYSNKLKRLVKTPKLHYLDPGVQKAILQKRGELAGNEFESAIVAEIYKQIQSINHNGAFFHLRTHDGAEIDLLFETAHGFIAFEIKMSNHITKTDARHLLNLDKILNKPLLKCFIISKDFEVKKISDKILAIPAAMFLT